MPTEFEIVITGNNDSCSSEEGCNQENTILIQNEFTPLIPKININDDSSGQAHLDSIPQEPNKNYCNKIFCIYGPRILPFFLCVSTIGIIITNVLL